MRTFFLGLIGLFFGAALLSSPDASGVGGGLLGGAVGIAFSLLIERGRTQKKLLQQVAALHEQQKSQADQIDDSHAIAFSAERKLNDGGRNQQRQDVAVKVQRSRSE